MPGRTFVNFLFLTLYQHRARHAAVFVIAVIVVALVSAFLMLSGAIRREVGATLDVQADFVVQKMRAGRVVSQPVAWADEFAGIPGVTAAVPRVWGRYFHEPNEAYFVVVGVDPFDDQATDALQRLVDGLDVRAFLQQDSMIIGRSVRRFLDDHHFTDSYVFKAPDRSAHEVAVHAVLPPDTDIVGSDVVIMDIDLARRALGLPADQCTDIALRVPNDLECDAVRAKLIQLHYDIRVIQKQELAAAYTYLFNYRSGVFLLLFLIVLVTFILILYQRYALITGADRREIGILRAVGWRITDVMLLKLAESAVVAVAAYLAGVIIAYLYVFFAGAPLLGAVFFGAGNLPMDVTLSRGLEPGLLGAVFLLFVVPFLGAVLLPVWRLAVSDPVEAMK